MAIYQGRKLISGTPNFTEIETQLNNKVDKIQGKGLSTNDFTNNDKTKLNGIEQNANNYSLPVATESELGGVKIGKNLSIDNEGKLNVEVTIPQATTELGGIRANPKQDSDTTEVRIDSNTGYLYCSGGGGSGGELNSKQDKPINDKVVYGFECATNNTGSAITVIGNNIMPDNIGEHNIGVGGYALNANTTGSQNVSIGSSSLGSNISGSKNTAIGHYTIAYSKSENLNTAIGYNALCYKIDNSPFNGYSNCTGVGANSSVSGSNQVQLGNSETTTYCYGAIQNRSDRRDKTDIQETELGIEFISKLKPRQFKWNYRDDYKGEENDGSKKRNRYHQGFIAQEVKAAMDELGVDFGGYQDHSINGGCDVLSLGYEEFIPPIVKVIQEQQQMIDKQQELIQSLEDRIGKLEQK